MSYIVLIIIYISRHPTKDEHTAANGAGFVTLTKAFDKAVMEETVVTVLLPAVGTEPTTLEIIRN